MAVIIMFIESELNFDRAWNETVCYRSECFFFVLHHCE